MEYKFIKKF
jgi:hypothetical protein